MVETIFLDFSVASSIDSGMMGELSRVRFSSSVIFILGRVSLIELRDLALVEGDRVSSHLLELSSKPILLRAGISAFRSWEIVSRSIIFLLKGTKRCPKDCISSIGWDFAV